MPKPSPRAHLPHSDAHKTSTFLPRSTHRTVTSAPNNEVIGRKMSVRKLLESLPKREHDADRSSSACNIRARKIHSRRNGHSMVVFKRTGTGKDRSPCGLSNCSRCGIFWKIYISGLEKAVPGLVCEQLRPPKSKLLCGFDAPSTPGSTMSTLTEFTEDFETQHSTPASVSSSPADQVSQDSGASTSSCASPASTLTAFSGDNHICTSSFPSLLSSLYTLTDLDEISNPFSASMSPESLMSASSGVSEHASSISTLTDFTSLASSSSLSSPPSSFSSLPPTLSTPIPTPPQRILNHRTRSHRDMICMSDGSAWLPPTLERVQAYIASQGSRRLTRSARNVVEQKAGSGSKVARDYERDIMKVDLKTSKRSKR